MRSQHILQAAAIVVPSPEQYISSRLLETLLLEISLGEGLRLYIDSDFFGGHCC
jgi:hypothetical protein